MIILIACVDRNMGIGKDNKLLTHLPKDLKHFKETTEGHLVVFGKNTWDSLPVKPLPNRKNAVMTRDLRFHFSQVWRMDIDDVLYYGKHQKHRQDSRYLPNAFICGGESIYRQFMPYADELIISHMDADFEADTFFPAIDDSKWTAYSSEFVEDRVNFTIKKYKAKLLQ
jgi:dihydrofolate reductase